MVLVGQVPPPMHGQALANRYLATGRSRNLRDHHVPMRFSSDVADVGRLRWSKVARLPEVAAKVWWHALTGRRDVLVYAVGARNPVPLVRDAVLLTLARPLFGATALHVHTGRWGDQVRALPRPLRWFVERAHRGVDALVELDESVHEPAFARPRRTRYLPYGVSDPHGSPPRAGPLPDDPRGTTLSGTATVVFVGNLYEAKGTHELVRAAAVLRDRGVRCRIVLAGGSPGDEDDRRLHELVSDLAVDDVVELAGPRFGADKEALLRSASALCLPTRYPGEGMPLSIIEAMARGLPVIATRWRAVPALVDDGATGYLVEPGDVAALADRLEAVLRDPALAARLGDAARQRYEAHFSLDRFHERFEAIISEMVGRPVPDAPLAARRPTAGTRSVPSPAVSS